MRRRCILTAILLMIMSTGLAHSDVNWIHETDEAHSYAFLIDRNEGAFFYPPAKYMATLSDTDRKAYSENQGEFDPFNSVAKGEILAFDPTTPGELWMHAMAMGPDWDPDGNPINPTDGLKVQAYAQIIPDSLDENHGIDVDQKITSWSTRWFTVEKEVSLEFMAELKGNLLFDDFNSISDPYHATKVISAEVTLEALVVSDTGEILSAEEKASMEVAVEDSVSTTLKLPPSNSEGELITYQLKGRIILESDITNYDWATGDMLGTIDGTFNIGTPETPMALTATITKATTGDSLTDDQGAQEVNTDGTPSTSDSGGGGGGGCFIDAATYHEK